SNRPAAADARMSTSTNTFRKNVREGAKTDKVSAEPTASDASEPSADASGVHAGQAAAIDSSARGRGVTRRTRAVVRTAPRKWRALCDQIPLDSSTIRFRVRQ